jgi:hypothetical protein
VIVRVDLPYADVRAGDLCLRLGAPAHAAIEVLRAQVGGWEVELRLLGCSHQALVDRGAELSETVACLPGAPGALPRRRRDHAPSAEYLFRARVERLGSSAYRWRARAILETAKDDPLALAGVFPEPTPTPAAPVDGATDPVTAAVRADRPTDALPAFTALCLRPLAGGVQWTTWHGYPQTAELVVTHTRLERRL